MLPEGFVPPKLGTPLRILVRGRATAGWYRATVEEQERVLPRLLALIDAWRALGFEPLASFDDDLLRVGETPNDFGWYLLGDVPSLDAVVAMLQCVRESIDGVRLDSYFAFEARPGRPFFPTEAHD